MSRTHDVLISEFDLDRLENKLQELEQLVAVKRSNNRRLDARNKRLERELQDMRKELATQRELAERLEQENADLFLHRWAKAQERAIDAERERDQYKGLLIRLHNDLFVHHGGQAVREFKELFREENYN